MTREFDEIRGNAPIVFSPFTPIGNHITAGITSSGVYQPTVPADSNYALTQTITQNVRFTLDGTDPTTTIGFQISVSSDPVLIPITSNTTLKFIAEVTGATLQLQFGE